MTFFSGKEFSHRQAAAAALFVTILWSTSWVLIKFGLGSLPALTFAGLRYTMAWLCLLPFCLRTGGLQVLASSRRRDWMLLVALGLVYYAGAQGAQYVSLAYLPAVTVNLLISFTVLVVALLSKALLGRSSDSLAVGRDHPGACGRDRVFLPGAGCWITGGGMGCGRGVPGM